MSSIFVVNYSQVASSVRMASSGVIPLSPAVLPPYPSIHYRPRPPWPPNAVLPPVVQQTRYVTSPVRPTDLTKAEPAPSPPPPSESPGPGPVPKAAGECPSPLRNAVKRTRRKRCGQCEGCLRKDNCGSCSVCTNPNSTNSICKYRRCEVLTRRRSVTVSGGYKAKLMHILCRVYASNNTDCHSTRDDNWLICT